MKDLWFYSSITAGANLKAAAQVKELNLLELVDWAAVTVYNFRLEISS